MLFPLRVIVVGRMLEVKVELNNIVIDVMILLTVYVLSVLTYCMYK